MSARVDIAAIRATVDEVHAYYAKHRGDHLVRNGISEPGKRLLDAMPALCSRVAVLEAALRATIRALGPAAGTHGEPCRDADCHIKGEACDALDVARAALEGE